MENLFKISFMQFCVTCIAYLLIHSTARADHDDIIETKISLVTMTDASLLPTAISITVQLIGHRKTHKYMFRNSKFHTNDSISVNGKTITFFKNTHPVGGLKTVQMWIANSTPDSYIFLDELLVDYPVLSRSYKSECRCKIHHPKGKSVLSVFAMKPDKCRDEIFGQYCESSCNCAQYGECHVISGKCLSGRCKPGYLIMADKLCQTPCKKERYGYNCSEICLCQENQTCDHTSGKCNSKAKSKVENESDVAPIAVVAALTLICVIIVGAVAFVSGLRARNKKETVETITKHADEEAQNSITESSKSVTFDKYQYRRTFDKSVDVRDVETSKLKTHLMKLKSSCGDSFIKGILRRRMMFPVDILKIKMKFKRPLSLIKKRELHEHHPHNHHRRKFSLDDSKLDAKPRLRKDSVYQNVVTTLHRLGKSASYDVQPHASDKDVDPVKVRHRSETSLKDICKPDINLEKEIEPANKKADDVPTPLSPIIPKRHVSNISVLMEECAHDDPIHPHFEIDHPTLYKESSETSQEDVVPYDTSALHTLENKREDMHFHSERIRRDSLSPNALGIVHSHKLNEKSSSEHKKRQYHMQLLDLLLGRKHKDVTVSQLIGKTDNLQSNKPSSSTGEIKNAENSFKTSAENIKCVDRTEITEDNKGPNSGSKNKSISSNVKRKTKKGNKVGKKDDPRDTGSNTETKKKKRNKKKKVKEKRKIKSPSNSNDAVEIAVTQDIQSDNSTEVSESKTNIEIVISKAIKEAEREEHLDVVVSNAVKAIHTESQELYEQQVEVYVAKIMKEAIMIYIGKNNETPLPPILTSDMSHLIRGQNAHTSGTAINTIQQLNVPVPQNQPKSKKWLKKLFSAP